MNTTIVKKPRLTKVQLEAKVAEQAIKIAEMAERLVKLDVFEKNSWYIDNALYVRIGEMTKSVDGAKKTLASAENDGSDPYRSLAGMVEHLEGTISYFTKAYDRLKAAGLR